jgi:hypothetical protein
LRLARNAIDRCGEAGELDVDPRRFDGGLRSLNLALAVSTLAMAARLF